MTGERDDGGCYPSCYGCSGNGIVWEPEHVPALSDPWRPPEHLDIGHEWWPYPHSTTIAPSVTTNPTPTLT